MAPPAYDAPPGMRKKQDYTARAANLRLATKEQKEQWERYWAAGPFRPTANLNDEDFQTYLSLLRRHRAPGKEKPLTRREFETMQSYQRRIVAAGADVVRPSRNPFPWEKGKRRLESFTRGFQKPGGRAAREPYHARRGRLNVVVASTRVEDGQKSGAGAGHARLKHGRPESRGLAESLATKSLADIQKREAAASESIEGDDAGAGTVFEAEKEDSLTSVIAAGSAIVAPAATSHPGRAPQLLVPVKRKGPLKWAPHIEEPKKPSRRKTKKRSPPSTPIAKTEKPPDRRAADAFKTSGAAFHRHRDADSAKEVVRKARVSFEAVDPRALARLLRDKTAQELRKADMTGLKQEAAREELSAKLKQCAYCRHNADFCPRCAEVANGWLAVHPFEFARLDDEVAELTKSMLAETFTKECYPLPEVGEGSLSGAARARLLRLEKVNAIITEQNKFNAWFAGHVKHHHKIQNHAFDKPMRDRFGAFDDAIRVPEEYVVRTDALAADQVASKSGQLRLMEAELGQDVRPRCPWAEAARDRGPRA